MVNKKHTIKNIEKIISEDFCELYTKYATRDFTSTQETICQDLSCLIKGIPTDLDMGKPNYSELISRAK